MQYKLHSVLAAALLAASFPLSAQTIVTFDDLKLPAENTSYLQGLKQDGLYPFTSGNATFYGRISYDGGMQSLFNYSNITDTIDGTFNNMWAAITGSGVDYSDNYGIAYAESDESDFGKSVENGPKLSVPATGAKVAGAYITNSTWGHHWIKENYKETDWYKLTIRGYLKQQRTTDSVVLILANGSGEVVDAWQWVNLQSLGLVDSLTFQATSSNTMTPFYFAIDNLITLDESCPSVQHIAAVSLNEESATINWSNIIPDFDARYELAWDQSATKEPLGTATETDGTTYEIKGLQPATTYYVHIRTKCGDGNFSAWDTASFQTLASNTIAGIQNSKTKVRISPNPATTTIHINSMEKTQVAVYNLEGKALIATAPTQIVDITNLPAGMYLLQVKDVHGQWTENIRFVKTN